MNQQSDVRLTGEEVEADGDDVTRTQPVNYSGLERSTKHPFPPQQGGRTEAAGRAVRDARPASKPVCS